MEGRPIDLRLNISTGDGESLEDLQVATVDLREELIEAGFAARTLPQARSGLPEKAKGATGSILGDIIVAAVPVVLPKLFAVLRSWKGRNHRRSFQLRPLTAHVPSEVLLDSGAADYDLDRFVELLVKNMSPGERGPQ
jgi:hypothetical protein